VVVTYADGTKETLSLTELVKQKWAELPQMQFYSPQTNWKQINKKDKTPVPELTVYRSDTFSYTIQIKNHERVGVKENKQGIFAGYTNYIEKDETSRPKVIEKGQMDGLALTYDIHKRGEWDDSYDYKVDGFIPLSAAA